MPEDEEGEIIWKVDNRKYGSSIGREHGEEIEKFFKGIEWGVLMYEFSKANSYCAGYEKSSIYRYLKEFYIPTALDWSETVKTLLHPRHSYNTLTGRGAGGRCHKNSYCVRSMHLMDNAPVLSDNKSKSYGRIFFEIGEDIKELNRKKIITPSCGYNILKIIYDSKNISCKDVIGCNTLGLRDKENKRAVIRTRIDDLLGTGLISKKDDMLQVIDEVRGGFEIAKKYRSKIKNWEHRIDWLSVKKPNGW